jgi:hypothetical protein
VCDLFVQTEEARFGESGTLSMHAFMQRLAPELDNARAALAWAMGDPGDLALAVALTGASAEAFRMVGLSQEASGFIEALQARVDDQADPDRAAIFWCGVCFLGEFGRLPKATLMQAGVRAERIYRRRGSRRRLYFVLYWRAWSLNTFGEHAEAEAILPEIQDLEDPDWPSWVRALRRQLQAAICMWQQRFEDARRLLIEERALLEREPGEELRLYSCLSLLCQGLCGSRRDEEVVSLARTTIERSRGGHTGPVQAYLMASLTFLGRLDEADQTMRQAMAAWRRDGLLLFFRGYLAMLLAEQGRYADAARVDGAAAAFIDRCAIAHDLVFKRVSAQMQQRFDAACVDPADIERWRREGERLDEASLAAVCLGDSSSMLNGSLQ